MTDDSSLVPQWMRDKKAEMDRTEALRQQADAQERIAELLIESKGAGFWQSLKEKLHITVDALPTLNLTGSFDSPLADANHVHIEVSSRTNHPQASKVDIHFDGSKMIRVSGLVGVFEFRLVTRPHDEIVGVQPDHRSTARWTPDQTAEEIMKRMVEQASRPFGGMR
jgi:hypothetical protein